MLNIHNYSCGRSIIAKSSEGLPVYFTRSNRALSFAYARGEGVLNFLYPVVYHAPCIIWSLHELSCQNEKIEGAGAVGSANKTVYVTDLSIRQNEETLSSIFLAYP